MSMEQYSLWQRTMANQGDGLDPQREILRQAFLEFRQNVALLVSEIGGLLPDLTVHDISHLDALWRVADQIAGADYPMNPAEAFVLGGAILLHDSAHVLAAYENRLDGLKATPEWKDLVAQEFGGNDPSNGSCEQQYVLFQVLRQLHARQARCLPFLTWASPGKLGAGLKLLPHPLLLEYYGTLIGEIAESHHWSSRKVGEVFNTRHVNPPAFLTPATWQVDALKIAFLLRTADATHIDAMRAPWFLFALRQPKGVSADHWRFQAKLGQPTRNENGEIRLTSGSPFGKEERRAWWLAYDTACMIDKELREAQLTMRDLGRRTFSANAVSRISTAESFARDVQVEGWEPISVAAKISDVPRVIANLGGAKLYGDQPSFALRELLQNSADAVRALRALGSLNEQEGEIEVRLERIGTENWLHVTDTGIGMSRHVLTNVLLDFGTSFWSGESSRTELPGLASTGFIPIGKFGIGFFSVFMLGTHIKVSTKRFRKANSDSTDQWILEFGDTADNRPMLRQPMPNEELKRSGTRVSVSISDGVLKKLVEANGSPWEIEGICHKYADGNDSFNFGQKTKNLERIVAALCPTIDINVRVKTGDQPTISAVRANDWINLSDDNLLARLYPNLEAREIATKMKSLVKLVGKSDEVVGRVCHAHGYGVAVCTHGGIRSGSAPQMHGVILGYNSPDLARRESEPIAPASSWQKWANDVLDTLADGDSTAAIDLHPLCLNRQPKIYQIDNKYLTASEVKKWLIDRTEVTVFDGELDYEDYDDMSRDSFRYGVKRLPDIIFLPYSTEKFAAFIKVPPINYQKEFEKILKEAWGRNFECTDDHAAVGHVGHVEIERPVYAYKIDEESESDSN